VRTLGLETSIWRNGIMSKSPETPEALFIRVLQINPELDSFGGKYRELVPFETISLYGQLR